MAPSVVAAEPAPARVPTKAARRAGAQEAGGDVNNRFVGDGARETGSEDGRGAGVSDRMWGGGGDVHRRRRERGSGKAARPEASGSPPLARNV